MANIEHFLSLLKKYYELKKAYAPLEGISCIVHDFIEEYLPAGQFKDWQNKFKDPVKRSDLFFDFIIRYGSPKHRKFLHYCYTGRKSRLTYLKRKKPSYEPSFELIKEYSLEELLRTL